MLHREGEVRLEVIELASAVVAHALELVGEHVLLLEQRGDGVGQLDLAAGSRGLVLEVVKDARREYVAAYDAQPRRRLVRIGFFDDTADAMRRARLAFGLHD